ncbi:hypothetical protein GG344DRAFT_70020 [Lentinula edodes]|nr:hypothetical protein GG344DRAFT_70020 [Lentinula edodes]
MSLPAVFAYSENGQIVVGEEDYQDMFGDPGGPPVSDHPFSSYTFLPSELVPAIVESASPFLKTPNDSFTLFTTGPSGEQQIHENMLCYEYTDLLHLPSSHRPSAGALTPGGGINDSTSASSQVQIRKSITSSYSTSGTLNIAYPPPPTHTSREFQESPSILYELGLPRPDLGDLSSPSPSSTSPTSSTSPSTPVFDDYA